MADPVAVVTVQQIEAVVSPSTQTRSLFDPRIFDALIFDCSPGDQAAVEAVLESVTQVTATVSAVIPVAVVE